MRKSKGLTEIQVAAFGIGGAVFLETIALLKGIDGIMFGATMTAIGGVVGWVMKDYHKKRK